MTTATMGTPMPTFLSESGTPIGTSTPQPNTRTRTLPTSTTGTGRGSR